MAIFLKNMDSYHVSQFYALLRQNSAILYIYIGRLSGLTRNLFLTKKIKAISINILPKMKVYVIIKHGKN